jgi:hypothetical protein
MKGVHVIGCNIEIPSKFGFEVNWGGKVVRQFKGGPDFIGTEYHGAGTFMVVPQYRPGNTGKMTYKIEVLY